MNKITAIIGSVNTLGICAWGIFLKIRGGYGVTIPPFAVGKA